MHESSEACDTPCFFAHTRVAALVTPLILYPRVLSALVTPLACPHPYAARLAEDRFYNRFPCIIITAKGQPDVATRLFLSKLKRDLRIPVLALVDADPYGLKIISVYMQGSKNMAFDSANLTTPDIKWLGVRPSDLDKFNIPEQCRLEMSQKDMETGQHMLKVGSLGVCGNMCSSGHRGCSVLRGVRPGLSSSPNLSWMLPNRVSSLSISTQTNRRQCGGAS